MICNCSNIEKPVGEKVTRLMDENMPPLLQLNLTKVDLLEEERIAFFRVYCDSILVINKTYTNDSFLLSIINFKNHALIGNYLKKGNGPNELLQFTGINNQNRVLVQDIVKKQISIFNIDSAILYGQLYKPILRSMEGRDFAHFDLLTDTSLVFYNPWHLKNCGNIANENAPELLVSGLNGIFEYTPQKDIGFVANEARVHVISNIEKNRVFLAYRGIPQFSLLDSNLDTIKIICGPDAIKKRNYKYENSNGNIYNSVKNIYSSCIYSTNNTIFVDNERITGMSMRDFMNFTDANSINLRELYSFDWNGNLIARYQLPIKPYAISFSEATNVLYITAKDKNDDFILYKAQL